MKKPTLYVAGYMDNGVFQHGQICYSKREVNERVNSYAGFHRYDVKPYKLVEVKR